MIMASSSNKLILPALVAAAVGLAVSAPALAQGSNPADSYKRSYALEASGKYADALAAITPMATKLRSSYFFQMRLGWLRYLAGKHAASVTAYKMAAALKPAAVETHLGMTLPLIATRQWKDAETAAKSALRLVPGNYLATTRLAWIQYNLGRFADAERTYRAVLKRYPSSLEMNAGLGWALLKQERKVEAASLFLAILTRSPEYATAKAGLAAARQ